MIKLSLRTKISFSVGLIIFIVLGTSTLVNIQNLERNYLQAIEWRAEALAQGILNQIMNNQDYDPNYYINNPRLLEVFSLQCMQLYELNREKNVAHFSIINASKVIAAHNIKSLWNTPVESAVLRESLDRQELVTVLDGDTYHTLIPIVWDQAIYLGSFDIGFPKHVVDRQARELLMNSAILFCVYLVLAIFAISILMHVMLRNISQIKQGIERLFHNPNYTLPAIKGELNIIVDKINELVKNVNWFQSYNRYIVESSINGVLSISNEGNIIRVNRVFYTIFPHLDETIVNKPVTEVLDKTILPLVEQSLYHNMCYTNKEIQLFNKILEVSSTAVVDDFKKRLGVLFLFKDITLIKKYEKELQERERMAVLGEMALGVAHEIKNPLTSVKGFTQMLQRTSSDNGKAATYLNLIDAELNRVNKLLNELLVYGGRTPLQLTCEDLERMIAEVIEKFQSTHQQIRFKQRIHGKNFHLHIDKHKVLQVFDNFIQNAIDALEEKRNGVIGIFVKEGEEDLTITFLDNGCGIRASNINKVLHPFFTTKSKGHGFGLPISYKIIENHGGNLTILSQEGYYTKIMMTLPKNPITKEAV